MFLPGDLRGDLAMHRSLKHPENLAPASLMFDDLRKRPSIVTSSLPGNRFIALVIVAIRPRLTHQRPEEALALISRRKQVSQFGKPRKRTLKGGGMAQSIIPGAPRLSAESTPETMIQEEGDEAGLATSLKPWVRKDSAQQFPNSLVNFSQLERCF